ncbi:J domain-containing protein [Vibrio breoganii]|uniref:J domain-containing protein n=1 Tax=Vibrio breoganii TaxID=553239 RepID=UPI000C83EA3B|nr:J domain-containing protein [Vibrio breoganii]PMK26290.1 hypothetical protein BCU03_19060 [Vibrio breoganii]
MEILFIIIAGIIIYTIFYKNENPNEEKIVRENEFQNYRIIKNHNRTTVLIDSGTDESKELLNEYLNAGYKEVALVSGKSKEEALSFYMDSIRLSPIEEANQTIRNANRRISELKLNLESVKAANQSLAREIESIKVKENEAQRKLKDEVEYKIKIERSLREKKERISELETKLSKSKNDLTDIQWLGFTMSPNKHDLRKKYRALSNIYHPDKGGCNQVMARINDAYQRLSTNSY